MNQIARHPAQDNRMLALIRRTVAQDCNDDEFNMFVSNCQRLGLDPLRRQAYALVYNKDKPEKRRMSIIVGIDGFRAVAARSGCYRPDEDEPRYEIDPAQKSETNPLGLVKCTVRIHQHSHGQWFPVSGTAYWDEFCPVKEEWARGDDGRRAPTGRKAPDGKWATMPRLMLAKCAEAQALRRAWPDDFSNVYAPEEMDRAQADLLPADAATQAAIEDRQMRAGLDKTVLMDWLDNRPLEPVPVGKVADRVIEFMDRNKDELSQIMLFRERNQFGLREFWTLAPTDALELKRQMEARIANGGAARMSTPLPCHWDGESFIPLKRFAKQADAEFTIGETYTLVEHQDRSAKSHAHFFATVGDVWSNLPEDVAERFRSSEHLRKWCLIKAGFADHRQFVAGSKAEALRLASFITPMDEYAVVRVENRAVDVWTAQSQSMRAMGKQRFQESKDAVLAQLDKLLGVEPGQVEREAGRAA